MSLKGYKGVIYGDAVQELFEQAKKTSVCFTGS